MRSPSIPPYLPRVAQEAYNVLFSLEKNVVVQRSSIHRRGLFAGEDVNMGELIVEYTGERFLAKNAESRQEFHELRGIEGDYMVTFPDNWFGIDATMRGSVARFANNSCNPNCELVVEHLPGCGIEAGGDLCGDVVGFTRACIHNILYLRAIRAIRKGDELTFQYNLNYDETDRVVGCRCGARCCKGYM